MLSVLGCDTNSSWRVTVEIQRTSKGVVMEALSTASDNRRVVAARKPSRVPKPRSCVCDLRVRCGRW